MNKAKFETVIQKLEHDLIVLQYIQDDKVSRHALDHTKKMLSKDLAPEEQMILTERNEREFVQESIRHIEDTLDSRTKDWARKQMPPDIHISLQEKHGERIQMLRDGSWQDLPPDVAPVGTFIPLGYDVQKSGAALKVNETTYLRYPAQTLSGKTPFTWRAWMGEEIAILHGEDGSVRDAEPVVPSQVREKPPKNAGISFIWKEKTWQDARLTDLPLGGTLIEAKGDLQDEGAFLKHGTDQWYYYPPSIFQTLPGETLKNVKSALRQESLLIHGSAGTIAQCALRSDDPIIGIDFDHTLAVRTSIPSVTIQRDDDWHDDLIDHFSSYIDSNQDISLSAPITCYFERNPENDELERAHFTTKSFLTRKNTKLHKLISNKFKLKDESGFYLYYGNDKKQAIIESKSEANQKREIDIPILSNTGKSSKRKTCAMEIARALNTSFFRLGSLDNGNPQYKEVLARHCQDVPIEPMLKQAREWIAEGYPLAIITSRIDIGTQENPTDIKKQDEDITNWCMKHMGMPIPIGSRVSKKMVAFYDDIALAYPHMLSALLHADPNRQIAVDEKTYTENANVKDIIQTRARTYFRTHGLESVLIMTDEERGRDAFPIALGNEQGYLPSSQSKNARILSFYHHRSVPVLRDEGRLSRAEQEPKGLASSLKRKADVRNDDDWSGPKKKAMVAPPHEENHVMDLPDEQNHPALKRFSGR